MKKEKFSKVIMLIFLGFFSFSIIFINGCGKKETENKAIMIGAVLPLTGAASEFGQYNKETTELVVEEFKQKYNINLNAYIEDSKSSPKDAINAYRKLILAHPKTQIISSELSSVSMAVAPLAKNEDRYLLAIAATPKLNDYPNVLRNYPIANLEASKFEEAINTYIKINKKIKVVIFYVNDEFGISTATATENKIKTNPLISVAQETYGTEAEIRSTVLKHKDAQAVILIGYGKEMGLTIREFRNYNKKAVIIASPEVAFKDPLSLIPLPDPFLYYVDLQNPDSSIVALYEKKFNRYPNLVDLLVWDGLHIIIPAVIEHFKENEAITWKDISSSILNKEFTLSVGTAKVDPQGNILYPLVLRNSTRLDSLKAKYLK